MASHDCKSHNLVNTSLFLSFSYLLLYGLDSWGRASSNKNLDKEDTRTLVKSSNPCQHGWLMLNDYCDDGFECKF